MKHFKIFSLLLFTAIILTACSSDDDNNNNNPEPIVEEEVITTLNVTLTPSSGTNPAIILQFRDLDADGPNPPTIAVSGDLISGVEYNGSIELLNETVSPAEDITEQVEELSDEHQFFYTLNGALDATTAYTNFDSNGAPLGTSFSLTAGAASSGTLTFTLRHEPKKPNTGLEDAGGETDITATFDVTVQ